MEREREGRVERAKTQGRRRGQEQSQKEGAKGSGGREGQREHSA